MSSPRPVVPSSAAPTSPPAYTVLGGTIHAYDENGIVSALLSGTAGSGPCRFIASQNLHGLYLIQHHPEVRAAYALADSAYIDGMPLVWWGKLMGYPLTRAHRNTMMDFLDRMLGDAERLGKSVYFLGSLPEVNARALAAVRRKFPRLRCDGGHGYFPPEKNADALEHVIRFAPDLLLVGMSMPKQELWIAENLARLRGGVVTNVGASIDMIAGHQPTPPAWVGRLGFSWLYRLSRDPRRLAFRYLVEPWSLLPVAVREWKARQAKSPGPR